MDPNGKPWDVAVAGQPFLLHSSEETPLVRATSPIRKDQQDTESEPGEQSLEGWWLRSQESFHKGAGVKYQESRVDLEPSERFAESMGVDVWTPGQVSLLKKTATFKAAASTSLLAQGVDGTTPVVFQASGSALYRVTASGSAAVTWGGASTILDLDVWDGYYYASCSDGVYRGTIAGGAGTKLWTLASPTTVKYRRVGGFALLLVDANCYDVTVEAGSPTLPAVLLTLKEAGWQWTGITRLGGTLRAAGHSAGTTAVWRFTPTVSSTGWTYAQATGLPRGEIVYSLDSYYDNYLVLGTNRGVRFATPVDETQYTFGPLTWEVPTGGGPVRGVHTIGRYVYAAAENALADGKSGLVRIDPETEISAGRFAWANDLQVGTTGTLGDVVDLDGRPVFAVSATGSLIAHATDLISTGYLTTGKIRYRMIEPKIFKYVKIVTPFLNGRIDVAVVDYDDTVTAVDSFVDQGYMIPIDTLIPDLGPRESIALKLTLSLTGSTTLGPILRAYQLKATPAPKRSRVYRLPLSCWDIEQAFNGTTLGYKGYGLHRLQFLELAEEGGDVVDYVDYASGVTRSCVVDEIQFRQTSPPGRSGWGGVAYVTLRSVD